MTDFAVVTLHVVVFFRVVALHEGLAFFAGEGFFRGDAGIGNFILDGIIRFGSGFLSSLVAFFEGLFHFLEKPAVISAATVTLSGISGVGGSSKGKSTGQDRSKNQILSHLYFSSAFLLMNFLIWLDRFYLTQKKCQVKTIDFEPFFRYFPKGFKKTGKFLPADLLKIWQVLEGKRFMDFAALSQWVHKSLFDDYLGATALSLAFIFIGCFFWRTLIKWARKTKDNHKTSLALIGESVRVPGYLVFITFGIELFLVLSPDFKAKANWITGTALLSSFLGVLLIGEGTFAFFVDFYLQEKRRTEVPRIFKQLFKGIIYLIVAMSFLSTTYKIDITPLLTTSAVFTMVIGLALQDVLGNLFSGLSVHISPPFKIGDWVKVAGFTGKVVESNWRATTIKSANKELVVLPNNDIAKKEIVNLSYYDGLLMFEFNIGLAYEISPDKARHALFEACDQVPEIVSNPVPKVFLDSFGDSAINYRIRYWIPENGEQLTIRNNLASRIWYRVKREGWSIPFPIREIYTHPERDLTDKIVNHRLELISGIDFLKQLDRSHLVFIAQNLRELWFQGGEVLVRKGSEGSDFYIIDQGAASVFLDETGAKKVATLHEGNFFGEMSLLTGEPRSATVVADSETRLLVMCQETLKSILDRDPNLAKVLSDILIERQNKNISAQEMHDAKETTRLEIKAQRDEAAKSSLVLFERIKQFFKLR